MKTTTLYRLYDADGVLLYVGVAGNPGRRFEQHAGDKPWWGEVARTELQHFTLRSDALDAELKAIHNGNPRYNVAGNKQTVPLIESALSVPTYHPETLWTFRSLRSDFERTEPLVYHWEANGSSISDDYCGDEATALDLWFIWTRRVRNGDFSDDGLRPPKVPIYWMLTPCFETAPFQAHPVRYEDFLSFFTWPYDAITGEPVNWNLIPVADFHWTPDQPDKGGFIQELTGWKPGPLQPFVDIDQLEYAAGLTRPPAVRMVG